VTRCNRTAALCALALALGLPGRAACQDPPDVAAGRAAVGAVRALVAPAGGRVQETVHELEYRGRRALVFEGRRPGAPAEEAPQDFAVFDLESRQLTTFAFFPNASRRTAGEAILPMSEIAARADALVRRLFRAPAPAFLGVERFRSMGPDSLYYTASYGSPAGEVRFLAPPIRLIFDALTGHLFRVDVDAEWYEPPPPAKGLLSKRAAERIAALALGGNRLAGEFGAGAAASRLAAGELYFVRGNGWLGFGAEESSARMRTAWAVAFDVASSRERGPHTLFVDARTGRVLGGMRGTPP
jgi:hypothetical protein